jgi:hypothetical protein
MQPCGVAGLVAAALMALSGCGGSATPASANPGENSQIQTQAGNSARSICTDPDTCCLESEMICEGNPDETVVCRCPDEDATSAETTPPGMHERTWLCLADSGELVCERDMPVPGTGDWNCEWTEMHYSCAQPGEQDAPPDGGANWECHWTELSSHWKCALDWPPNPSNAVPGAETWQCQVDDLTHRLRCSQAQTGTRQPTEEGYCGDGLDNDLDGQTDYDDEDCGCLDYPCCSSQKIALLSCEEALELKPGDFQIDRFSCTEVEEDRSLLTPYDTIVYYGEFDRYTSLDREPTEDRLSDYLLRRVEGGAKVVILPLAPSVQRYQTLLGMRPDYHPVPVQEAEIEVTEATTISAAFKQDAWAGYSLVQMNTSDKRWCGDLFFELKQGTRTRYNGHFHGYVKDDAERHGILLYVGVALGDELVVDFGEPFLAAQLEQTWDATSGMSQTCGLKCTRPVGTGVGKPAIYLYPTQTERVSVRLDFDGELVTSYPDFDETVSGWQVMAEPDGTLTDLRDGHEYQYLYWNGVSSTFDPDFSTGFVVRGADTRVFLQRTLAQLGLLPYEYNEMIMYWLPYMENHAYNLIHFAGEEYTRVTPMEISPTPDALLRVFMVFKELDEPVSIPAQPLPPFERRGFTVVEWGGSEIGGDWHVVR